MEQYQETICFLYFQRKIGRQFAYRDNIIVLFDPVWHIFESQICDRLIHCGYIHSRIYFVSQQFWLQALFSFAMEAMVGMCIGQTSIQERDFEQLLPKCSS